MNPLQALMCMLGLASVLGGVSLAAIGSHRTLAIVGLLVGGTALGLFGLAFRA